MDRPRRTNYRWMMGGFSLLVGCTCFMDRVGLSVAAPAIIRDLHFSKVEIGMIQTAFFIAYALFQLPAGTLAEVIGHRVVLPCAIAWWSMFTALFASCQAFWSWILVGGLFGLGEAPVFPGLNTALAHWFPKQERGKAVSCMVSGAYLGPVIGPPLAIGVMLAWGWRAIFLVFGLIGVVVACGYYALIRTSPRESRFVNAAEVAHIEGCQESDAGPFTGAPPWKAFFRSRQFWAIGAQFAMTDYIAFVFVAWLPLYLLEARRFSLGAMGVVAGLPTLGMAVGNILCGVMSDRLVGKGVTKSRVRTPAAALGLLFCCGSLCLAATATDKGLTILWLTLALSCLGCTMNASWTACMDLGGRFAGTVSGWMNFCGNLVGAAAPAFTAWIATHYGWQVALLTTAAGGLLGAICWLFVDPDVPLCERVRTKRMADMALEGAAVGAASD